MLQNAYVLAASSYDSIPCRPHHKKDLTSQALCSRWSKMLRNAPVLLGAGGEGRRPTRNPEWVRKQCESQDDARRAGLRRRVPAGPFHFIKFKPSLLVSVANLRNPQAVNACLVLASWAPETL